MGRKEADPRQVVCTECLADVLVTPGKTFFSNPKFTCPSCGKNFVYPMTERRRKVFIAILVVVGIFALARIAQGAIPIPGLLVVLAVGALLEDRKARQRLSKIRPHFVTRP